MWLNENKIKQNYEMETYLRYNTKSTIRIGLVMFILPSHRFLNNRKRSFDEAKGRVTKTEYALCVMKKT